MNKGTCTVGDVIVEEEVAIRLYAKQQHIQEQYHCIILHILVNQLVATFLDTDTHQSQLEIYP